MMGRVRRIGGWVARLVLSLILRIPFIIGVLAGFLGLCVVAFLAGFHWVYDGGGG